MLTANNFFTDQSNSSSSSLLYFFPLYPSGSVTFKTNFKRKHVNQVESKLETGGRGTTCLHVATSLVIYEHHRRVIEPHDDIRETQCS